MSAPLTHRTSLINPSALTKGACRMSFVGLNSAVSVSISQLNSDDALSSRRCADWSKDDKGFFYSRLPPPPGAEGTGDHKAGTETEANVNAKVYYHRLGTDQAEDILIAEDPTSDKSQLMFAVNMTPE